MSSRPNSPRIYILFVGPRCLSVASLTNQERSKSCEWSDSSRSSYDSLIVNKACKCDSDLIVKDTVKFLGSKTFEYKRSGHPDIRILLFLTVGSYFIYLKGM